MKPCQCSPPRIRLGSGCVIPYDKSPRGNYPGDCHYCYRYATDARLNEQWGGRGVLPVCPVHVDSGHKGSPVRADVAERYRIQLAVVPRPPCKHEGPVSESCHTCSADVTEQNDTRHCTHPRPSPQGTANVLGTSVESDRDFCTRNNFANARQRCWDCPDYVNPSYNPSVAPARIVLDLGAGGIGDGILALTAVAGLREKHPTTELVYNVGEDAIPFIKHFAEPSKVGKNFKSHSDQPVPGARQLNAGYYTLEATGQFIAPRWERYRANAGADRSVLPTLSRPEWIDSHADPDLRGRVLLFPLSTDVLREWPLFQWIELEARLHAAGYETAVMVHKKRVAGFKGRIEIGQSPERLMANIRQAGLVVANDSGPGHLAGVLGAPTVVVAGWWDMGLIFGFYPDVTSVQAPNHDQVGQLEFAPVWKEIEAKLLEHQSAGASLLGPDKLRTIRDGVRRTKGLPGWVSELGVFRGGSARLMAVTDPSAKLLLFDTFAGIPEDDVALGGHHIKGEFAASVEDVEQVMAGTTNYIRYVVGAFPQSLWEAGDSINAARFRFVHVDGDTQQTTEAACRYFVPRMARGGIIVFDDYDWPPCPGVKKVVDRWFGSDVVKIGNQALVEFSR